MDEGARDPRLRGARRLRRVRAPRRPGPEVDRAARPAGGEAVHARDGRDRRRRGDGQPHRLHGRAGRRADVPRRGRGRALGRSRRPRRRPLRARRARHAAARGLLPAARQRHHPGDGRDLGRPRLDVRARQGVQRRRPAARDQGGRAGAEARRVRDGGEGDPAPGHGDRRAAARSRRGTHSPMLDKGIGMGYVPAAAAGPGNALRSTSAARSAAPPSSRNRSTSERTRRTWPQPRTIPRG